MQRGTQRGLHFPQWMTILVRSGILGLEETSQDVLALQEYGIESVRAVVVLQLPMLYDSTNSSVGKKHLDPSHRSCIHLEKWQT